MKTLQQQFEEHFKWKQNNLTFKLYRYDIINNFIKKYNYVNYLEIGVRLGTNLREIIAKHKDGVDPGNEAGLVPEVNYPITSDKFFELITDHDIKYDIIFIDGLHHSDQVYKDIINSLKHLDFNGTIVCHDMNPLWELAQNKNKTPKFLIWNGDCWKAWAKLRSEREDLEMYVVDTDHGCGIIRFGKQQTIDLPKNAFELDFNYLENNRKELLNLITINEFFNKIND